MKHDFYRTTLLIDGRKIDSLFFETAHDKALKEELEKLGYTVFEIRDDGGEWCSPCTLEEKVLVDFWGYAAVGNEDGARFLSEWIMKEEFFALEDCVLSGWEPSEHCEIPIPQIAVITT